MRSVNNVLCGIIPKQIARFGKVRHFLCNDVRCAFFVNDLLDPREVFLIDDLLNLDWDGLWRGRTDLIAGTFLGDHGRGNM